MTDCQAKLHQIIAALFTYLGLQVGVGQLSEEFPFSLSFSETLLLPPLPSSRPRSIVQHSSRPHPSVDFQWPCSSLADSLGFSDIPSLVLVRLISLFLPLLDHTASLTTAHLPMSRLQYTDYRSNMPAQPALILRYKKGGGGRSRRRPLVALNAT